MQGDKCMRIYDVNGIINRTVLDVSDNIDNLPSTSYFPTDRSKNTAKHNISWSRFVTDLYVLFRLNNFISFYSLLTEPQVEIYICILYVLFILLFKN